MKKSLKPISSFILIVHLNIDIFSSIRRIVVQDETNDPINDDKGHNDDWVDHLGYKLNHLRKD